MLVSFKLSALSSCYHYVGSRKVLIPPFSGKSLLPKYQFHSGQLLLISTTYIWFFVLCANLLIIIIIIMIMTIISSNWFSQYFMDSSRVNRRGCFTLWSLTAAVHSDSLLTFLNTDTGRNLPAVRGHFTEKSFSL